jgi:tRNA threonylcarbamoyladenosine modification (KEOPS) complex  Pcc1 subunit
MTPGSLDFLMPKGSTFSRTLTWKISGSPVNLTDYTARMMARTSHISGTVVLDMTTSNGKITLGGTAGTITLSLSAADTAAITASSLSYDLELVSVGGVVTRLVEGQIVLTPEVTR